MIAKFHLPEFFDGAKIYSYFFLLANRFPEMIRSNTEIASIFGNFRGNIWNGGTWSYGEQPTKEQVERIIDLYNNQFNLPLCFTFTNPLLNEHDCYDRYANMIAKAGHNGKNRIRVVSPILEEYLRKEYPNYEYCMSVIGTEDKPYDIEHKYFDSVLPRKYNNNWELLNTIPMEDRKHLELICDEPCDETCPRVYEHYKIYAQHTLDFDFRGEDLKCAYGNTPEKMLFAHHHLKTERPGYISREMIDELYLPQGYENFKLTGRWNVFGPLFSLVNYIAKPEYKDDLIRLLLAETDKIKMTL